MIREKRERTSRILVLAYMAAVTAFLLSFAFAAAAKGPSGFPGMVVYALAAGFGLEFVAATWTGRFNRDRGRESLQS